MSHHIIWNGPENADATLVLAHGAGAPMDSEFMNIIAEGLGQVGVRVARFEFPYMQKRREDGKSRPPDRGPKLEAHWHDVISHLGDGCKLFIGGKSMGGRFASMIADVAGVQGVICLGYPFHPPGKPEKLRTDHLKAIATKTLILQGERDTFGTQLEVPGYDLSDNIEICWLPDGDHSLKPRKKSGHTHEENLAKTIAKIAEFIQANSKV